MKRGEALRDFEYCVKRHSDKLLSLKVAEKVQRQRNPHRLKVFRNE